jgi:hypothetical protein
VCLLPQSQRLEHALRELELCNSPAICEGVTRDSSRCEPGRAATARNHTQHSTNHCGAINSEDGNTTPPTARPTQFRFPEPIFSRIVTSPPAACMARREVRAVALSHPGQTLRAGGTPCCFSTRSVLRQMRPDSSRERTGPDGDGQLRSSHSSPSPACSPATRRRGLEVVAQSGPEVVQPRVLTPLPLSPPPRQQTKSSPILAPKGR